MANVHGYCNPCFYGWPYYMFYCWGFGAPAQEDNGYHYVIYMKPWRPMPREAYWNMCHAHTILAIDRRNLLLDCRECCCLHCHCPITWSAASCTLIGQYMKSWLLNGRQAAKAYHMYLWYAWAYNRYVRSVFPCMFLQRIITNYIGRVIYFHYSWSQTTQNTGVERLYNSKLLLWYRIWQ